MAKFKAILGDIRGKLAGNVFSRNTFGAYIRQKVTPVNPQTTYQQEARQLLANLAGQYQSELDDAQREAWKEYAVQNPVQDIFGDSIVLSGIAAFNKVNTIVILSGSSMIKDPPSEFEPPGALDSLALAIDIKSPATYTLTYDASLIGTNFGILVYGACPVSPGRNYVSNLYKYLGWVGSNPTSPVNIKTIWEARLGTPIEDATAWVRIKIVSTDSYKVSSPYDAKTVVVDTT